mmetsp:Transcript_30917/g.75403  ORF Transcript_30917/g.75403 Transcript_30917/m.75403 type:complete len:312 (-) Transcript_30917:203-1138(-)
MFFSSARLSASMRVSAAPERRRASASFSTIKSGFMKSERWDGRSDGSSHTPKPMFFFLSGNSPSRCSSPVDLFLLNPYSASCASFKSLESAIVLTLIDFPNAFCESTSVTLLNPLKSISCKWSVRRCNAPQEWHVASTVPPVHPSKLIRCSPGFMHLLQVNFTRNLRFVLLSCFSAFFSSISRSATRASVSLVVSSCMSYLSKKVLTVNANWLLCSSDNASETLSVTYSDKNRSYERTREDWMSGELYTMSVRIFDRASWFMPIASTKRLSASFLLASSALKTLRLLVNKLPLRCNEWIPRRRKVRAKLPP